MTKSINFFAAMPQEEFTKWNIGARQYAATRIDQQALNHQYDQLFFNHSIFNA
jgi:hypothetical protein